MYPRSLWVCAPLFGLLATLAAPAQAPQLPVDGPPPSLAESPLPLSLVPGARLDAPPALPDPGRSFGPRGTLSHVTGPGLGYRDGFNTLEGMIPIHQQAGQSLWFADLRGILSDQALLGANVGTGYRYYARDLNRVFGVNTYYDNRDTGNHTFHQIAGGFESLGCCWDFRGNWYVPVGGDRHQVNEFFFNPQLQTEAVCSNPRFSGHNILLDQLLTETLTRGHARQFDAAMTGFDLEAGAPVPYSHDIVKAYAGMYHYQVDGSRQAWGARGRLEARYNDCLALNLIVQNDRVFNTTVTFGAAISLGGLCSHDRHCGCCVAADRLGDPVERNYNIVVTQQQVVDTVSQTTTSSSVVVAFDPVTGQAIIVDHVASNAAAGGNGTFEHPFQTLAQLQAGSHPGDILLAHAGSDFENQSITLQNNQRFLAENPACPHFFTSQCGTFLLPSSGARGPAPIIDNSNGADSITLANNNEVSGFNITPSGADSSTAHGIAGNGITNFNINCNRIGFSDEDNGASPIFLVNARGTGLITGNTLHAESFSGANDKDGIHIENHGATALNVTVSGNTIVGVVGQFTPFGFDNGIHITTFDSAQVTAMITGNTISNGAAAVGGAGINVVTSNSSRVTATITGNAINFNGGEAIDFQADDSSQVTARVLNNTMNNNGVGQLFPINAMTIQNFSDATFGLNIAGNTISNNRDKGISINTGGTLLVAGITNNIFSGNGGLSADIFNSGTACLRLTGNTSDTNYQVGNNDGAGATTQLENTGGGPPNFGNIGTVIQVGTITLVPPGTCPVP